MDLPGAGTLQGTRVLTLGGIGPVQFCQMMLADQGADVVMVERPGGGPDVWDRALSAEGIDILGRGARRVEIDLKSDAGRALVMELVTRVDVVLEGFRPGVVERLDLGPDVLRTANPRLVVGRMTGYGQSGPLAARAGHDINYIARTGVLHAVGRSGGPPQVPLNLVADYGGGGMLLAFGICAALLERERSGQGQLVDTSMVDGVAILLASTLEKLANGHWRDERGTNSLDTGDPEYDVYETADRRWMAVGAREPDFRRALLAGLGLPELPRAESDEDRAERRRVLAARFRTRTRDEWAVTFASLDACVEPVLSLTEAVTDPALRERGTFRMRGGNAEPGPTPRFSRTPGRVRPPRGRLSPDQVLAAWPAGHS
ncbi:MAG: hypothetical protein ABS81_10915 [Pseudonocardia sp. SCN 72-86]|nr:MAG: hypothetical protein ABS81_10915 [Pseudonocardia sp. SCN 72-86]